MGIIRGFVEKKEYIKRAIKFFDYGLKIDFDNTPEEELDRIHRSLAQLENAWNITALEIAAPDFAEYRKMTHRNER